MSLSEVEAVFFLPFVVLVYWLLPARASWQNVWLLAASYVFCASWHSTALLLLLFGTLLDWLVGIGLAGKRARQTLLAISLIANVGTLAWFKYAGLFTGTSWLLPIGLSFYSMQKLGYVFEVFYGRREPTRSLLTFATFSAFFPQLTAGPISRARELLPQLERARRLSADAVASGAGAFLLGFVLKAYAADRLSVLVDPVFDAPAGYGAASCWLAAAAYALQVFCDFGGYSLMAIGTGRLLGIELPRNFDFPFLSRSLPEFWRRWHITLNRWLFDYIYTPLVTGTGWFRGRFRLGLVIVFLVSGAWHVKGLAYGGFLVWGLLHGLGMATQFTYDARYRQLCRADKRYVTLRRSTGYALAALLLTQLFFVVTMVPFHAHSLADAGVMARTMFGLRGGLGGGAGSNLAALHRGQVLVALLVPFVYHLLSLERVRSLRTALLRLPAPVRGVALGLLIVYLLVYVPVGASTFIYKNF